MRRSRAVAALGSASASEALESAFARLVPRRFSGLLAVAVDEAGPHVWSAGSWTTLPAAGGDPGGMRRQVDMTDPYRTIDAARLREAGERTLGARFSKPPG